MARRSPGDRAGGCVVARGPRRRRQLHEERPEAEKAEALAQGDKHVVLGLLGRIGAGKSHVAGRLAQLGPATVVDADALAHQALLRCAADGRLAEALGEEFVRNGQPRVDLLGARIFEAPALLRRLERLLHPHVHDAIRKTVAAHRAGGPAPAGPIAGRPPAESPALLVLDAPLLLEVGLDRECDALWFVEVTDDLRAERAASRGLSPEEVHRREAFQTPVARKRARSDLIIRNDVSAEALDRQLLDGLMNLGVPPHAGTRRRSNASQDGAP